MCFGYLTIIQNFVNNNVCHWSLVSCLMQWILCYLPHRQLGIFDHKHCISAALSWASWRRMREAARRYWQVAAVQHHWLLGHKSELSTSNKLLIYKTILKPIWTYGIQLWGSASTSNMEILQRFQSKALHMIVDAPWYVPNTVTRILQIPRVKEEIRCNSSQYNARLSAHPDDRTVNLMELPDNKGLRRHLPNDLPTRFLV
jgi:hypothetical protein